MRAYLAELEREVADCELPETGVDRDVLNGVFSLALIALGLGFALALVAKILSGRR